jgi:hypothetical protein
VRDLDTAKRSMDCGETWLCAEAERRIPLVIEEDEESQDHKL